MIRQSLIHKSLSAAAAVLVGAMLLAACGDDSSSSDTTTAGETAAADALSGTRWTLDVAGLDVPGADKVLPTIAFADGSVSGSAGCNTFTGSYTVSGDSLTLGQLASTQIACGTVETAVETVVLERLGKVAGYQATADSLTLTDSSGATLLTYAPAPAGVEGAWVATGYLNADKSGFVSVIIDTEITAAFGPDGTVAGSSGCNNYSGGYTIDGDSISMAQMISTQKACDAPEGIMDQEAGYLAALQSSVTFRNDGATLILLNADGQQTVMFSSKAG
jgi:heat shock protein HslJ